MCAHTHAKLDRCKTRQVLLVRQPADALNKIQFITDVKIPCFLGHLGAIRSEFKPSILI